MALINLGFSCIAKRLWSEADETFMYKIPPFNFSITVMFAYLGPINSAHNFPTLENFLDCAESIPFTTPGRRSPMGLPAG